MRTKVGIVFIMALVAAALAAYLAFNVVRDRGPVVVQATEAPTAGWPSGRQPCFRRATAARRRRSWGVG
jgi:paraquat-inducible protein B